MKYSLMLALLVSVSAFANPLYSSLSLSDSDIKVSPILCPIICNEVCKADCRIVNSEEVCNDCCNTICTEVCN